MVTSKGSSAFFFQVKKLKPFFCSFFSTTEWGTHSPSKPKAFFPQPSSFPSQNMRAKNSCLMKRFWRPRLVALMLLATSTALCGEEAKTTTTTTTTVATTSTKMLANKNDASKQSPPLPLPASPWSIAHRGASGLLPEHTMPAYKLAVEQVRDCFFFWSRAAEARLSRGTR